jgi:hypothetical protein
MMHCGSRQLLLMRPLQFLSRLGSLKGSGRTHSCHPLLSTACCCHLNLIWQQHAGGDLADRFQPSHTPHSTHRFSEHLITALASCKQSSGWLYLSLQLR